MRKFPAQQAYPGVAMRFHEMASPIVRAVIDDEHQAVAHRKREQPVKGVLDHSRFVECGQHEDKEEAVCGSGVDSGGRRGAERLTNHSRTAWTKMLIMPVVASQVIAARS